MSKILRDMRIASVAALICLAVMVGCGSGAGPTPVDDVSDTVNGDEGTDSAPDVAGDEGTGDQGTDTGGPTDASQDGNGADDGENEPDQGADVSDNGTDAIDPDTVGNPDYPENPAEIELHGACPLDSRLGGFKVEMNEDSGYTAIDGQVNDAVTPSLVPEVFMTEGDCTLLKRRRLVCNPTCSSDQTCGFDQTCIAAPAGQDMGMAVFRGLVKGVAINPIQPGNKYFYTRLAHPGFQPGTVLQAATSGGFFEPLEMYGVGVERIVTGSDKLVITEGQPLSISWDAPLTSVENTRSRVYFEINIDQHGATPLNLVCDLPDTGAATIPQDMIDAFIGAGVTGYPSAKLVRRTVDSVTSVKGCVDFQITSVRQAKVEVTGHIPCARNTDCPQGMQCNTLIQQCY